MNLLTRKSISRRTHIIHIAAFNMRALCSYYTSVAECTSRQRDKLTETIKEDSSNFQTMVKTCMQTPTTKYKLTTCGRIVPCLHTWCVRFGFSISRRDMPRIPLELKEPRRCQQRISGPGSRNCSPAASCQRIHCQWLRPQRETPTQRGLVCTANPPEPTSTSTPP